MDGDDWIDLKLRTPFLMNISGCAGSGKSTLISQIIKNRQQLIDEDLKNIYYIYNIDNIGLHEFRVEHPEIIFSPTIPQHDLSDSLIILDDFHQEMETSLNDYITRLAIKDRTHKNLSVIVTTHNLYGRNLRTFNLNCTYLVLFKFPRDRSVVQVLGSQILPGKKQFISSTYDFCMNLRRHGYIVFDFSPTQNDRFRLRSSLFPDEYCYTFTPSY